LKILQLIDTLTLGGAERIAVNMANLLTAHEIENILVATYQSGALANQLNATIPLFVLNKKKSLGYPSIL
jgi:hypothetical protein